MIYLSAQIAFYLIAFGHLTSKVMLKSREFKVESKKLVVNIVIEVINFRQSLKMV